MGAALRVQGGSLELGCRTHTYEYGLLSFFPMSGGRSF